MSDSHAQIPTPISAALRNGTFSEVLAATADHFGCQAGTVHLIKGGQLQLETSLNIPPLIVDLVKTVPIGKGIAGLAAERREPVMLCNLQTDTSGQARPAAKQTGMEGSIAVPMFNGTDLRGVLGIAKATAHDWTADEQAILLAIGAALAARRPGSV
jgi:GAF domain-containing protein